MSPIVPDPDPIALPAQVALLKVLLVALLPLHLFAMNLALGGGFVAAWATWRARRGAEMERRRYEALRGAVGSALVVATAATITLGIAPLLFLQVLYGPLFYTSSVLMAWWWMAVIVLLMAGYYSYYAFVFKQHLRGSSAPFALAGAVLLSLVGFLFTNNMTLMLRPERWATLYAASAAGLHLNVSDPTHGPRFLHFLVASFAVTGLFLALRMRGATDDARRWTAVFGARLFAGATHVQLLVGLGFLFTLPADVRALFLGGRVLDTVVLGGAVAAAIAATLIVRRAPLVAAALIGTTVFGMSFVRHCVREALIASIAPLFSTEALTVQPQVGPLVLFALLLVAGLVTLAWMIGKLVTAPVRG
jgi:hypothetical protein